MDLLELERAYTAQGFAAICGVDEAGRGPLAGPVYAAAVILHSGQMIEGVNDSKKLSEKKRDALYDIILRDARASSIAYATEVEIDQFNILGATFLAMRRAVEGLVVSPDLVLVDGNRDPGLPMESRTVIKGDAKSMSIAAASILAKVARDRFMLELDVQYPQYQFAQHKGYPTKAHYAALAEHGSCPVHRRTFLKKMH